MKIKISMAIMLFGVLTICNGQQNSGWEKWNWLMGDWIGEGSGVPGQGGGTFSFSFELDSNVIVRKSHSEYPSNDGKSMALHDDLMIIYKEPASNILKAIYFDNENHIINYTLSLYENTIVFTSYKVPDSPFFRLAYSLSDSETANTKFEISRDGENFVTYIEGKSKKIK